MALALHLQGRNPKGAVAHVACLRGIMIRYCPSPRSKLLALAHVFIFCAVLISPMAQAQQKRAVAAGEILIGYREDAEPEERDDALLSVGARVLKRLGSLRDFRNGRQGTDHVKVTLPVDLAIAALKRHPAVVYAEPNYVVKHSATSNDSYYTGGSLWGTYGNDAPVCGPSGTANSYGSDAEEAWSLGYTGSSSVYVGVIDEGVQFSHPDLAGNVWTNPFDPVDGIDNDGNGFIDDIHGWDFYNKDNSVFDALDGDAHGTHVSGTIGARGGNGAGIAGINWNVTIIPAKFLGPTGGYTSDAVNAINYLRDLKTRHGLNVVAMSNSWGGGGYSTALHTAILRAAKEGILFVAAAGNSASNNDSVASYPAGYTTLQGSTQETAASYEAVISVAAIGSNGTLASFSNYGAQSVDIGAPGVGIVSTVPTDSYASYSGTSMATPHVSGAIALYASAFPTATAAQIRDALLRNAAPTPSLVGLTATGGRLNLEGIFSSAPPTVPAVHDIAITSVTPASSSIRKGRQVQVSISMSNQGNQTETFTVSLSATGGSVGPAQSLTLAPNGSATAKIPWTAPYAAGTFTLTGRASVLSGETDTADNTASTTIKVK